MRDTNDAKDTSLSDLLQRGGRHVVAYKGFRIPVDYQKGVSDRAVFLFHGAAKRSKRMIPFFQGFLPNAGGAHQFSISDPTMLTTQVIASGWYSGADGENMQSVLRDFFREIREHLNCPRRVYVGASSGGFAALLYSHSDPGSVVVAAIPQTVLRNHYPTPVNHYRNECWPDCATVADFDSKADFDLAALYAGGAENTVIYVQSAGDRFHIANHFTPFLAALGDDAMTRLVCDVGFWGRLGHSGAAPPAAFLNWVETALTAEEPTADGLLQVNFDLHQQELQARIAESAPSGPPRAGPDGADLQLNALVRNYLLAGQ